MQATSRWMRTRGAVSGWTAARWGAEKWRLVVLKLLEEHTAMHVVVVVHAMCL